MKLEKAIFILVFFVSAVFSISSASGLNESVCCEKTLNNLLCQNVPSGQCAPGSRQAPTSCESTSFCKPGVCYGSDEGICMENTPEVACNLNNSKWSETSPPQCELGCCLLGNQAAFVPLVRCKRLASFAGIPVNYNQNIKSEAACILSTLNEDRGACVYEKEFEKTCTFTTRSVCSGGINGTGRGEFFKDKLCTAQELGTVCTPSTKTMCVPGKDDVYFSDSCGNPVNVYDSSKISGSKDKPIFDLSYWTNLIQPEQSCGAADAGGNAGSKTCGNCNYLRGTICRQTGKANSPVHGNNICISLNCVDNKGNQRKHGESWCVYDDSGSNGKGKDSVGSRFYKHVCLNGEEILEQCADFRQEECIQDTIKIPSGGAFSQAACRVNRWQDCIAQTEKDDCENTDRRDCIWKPGQQLGKGEGGACIPKNPPGLKFWEGETTKEICAQGNIQCQVVFEKGLFDSGDGKCVSGCECITPEWEKQRADLCSSLGDCGPNVNWINSKGYKQGFKIKIEKQ